MGQRQDAFDATVGFGIQKVGVVAKDATHDGLPTGTMKERGGRARQHKRIPALRGGEVVQCECVDAVHGEADEA